MNVLAIRTTGVALFAHWLLGANGVADAQAWSLGEVAHEGLIFSGRKHDVKTGASTEANFDYRTLRSKSGVNRCPIRTVDINTFVRTLTGMAVARHHLIKSVANASLRIVMNG